MSPLAVYYPLVLAVSAIISAAIAIFSWRRRPATGAASFSILMAGVFIWSLCDLLVLISSGFEAKTFWDKASYLGIALVPTAWLVFTLQYTSQDRWLTRRNLTLLSIEPLLTIIIVFTNEFHGLAWRAIGWMELGPFVDIDPVYGTWFWINTAYSYILLIIGILLLVRFFFDSPNLYREQAKILILGVSIPFLANILYLSSVYPAFQLDLTSFVFSLTGIVVAWGLYRYKLLDIVPVAQDAVFSSMVDGVVVLNSQNRLVNLNPAAQKMVGLSSSEDLGKNITHIWDYRLNLAEQHFGHEAEAQIDLEDVRGKRSYDVRISPLFDRSKSFVGKIIVLRDVTVHKQAEEALRKAHEDLERKVSERTAQLAQANDSLKLEIADRMQAQTERERLIKELEAKNTEMERFTYTVSHDLRSPLVTINGFISFLKKDMDMGDKKRIEDDLKRIGDAVTRMDRLLSDTLQLSRIGRVVEPPQDIAFKDIVLDALYQLSEKLKSEGVDISVAKDLPEVHVDKMRIVEVLVNLIENSIKYMGDQPRPRIEIGCTNVFEDAAFFVRDNGIGIDLDQQGKVFELFYKIDRKSEGTGAGLAIVKRIIEVHGGRIWIESEKDKGCAVYFTLPLAKGCTTKASSSLSSIAE